MTQLKTTVTIIQEVEKGKIGAILDGQINGPNCIIALSTLIQQIASGKVQYNKDLSHFQARSFDDRIKTPGEK